jgi:hypothetical protein
MPFSTCEQKKMYIYIYIFSLLLPTPSGSVLVNENNDSTVFLLLFTYKDRFRGPDTVWQLEKKHSVDYFTLEDLWEHYSESSAYGLAVPVQLQTTGKSITQHFVPYLSAVQIYSLRPKIDVILLFLL